MSITEERFREGSGEKFTATGNVRCQALSVSQINKWREEFDDYTTPIEALWPECQCIHSAVEGYYVCRFHGGRAVKAKPRKITDVVPIDMREKLEIILDNPMLISRHEDIALVQARIWQLMEELEGERGEEAWGYVSEALTELNRGNDARSRSLMIDALKHKENRKDILNEFYKAENVLKDLTRTQVSTMKDLQAMATVEQVSSLVNSMIQIIIEGADKYIEDKHKRAAFISYISASVGKLTNSSPKSIVAGVSDSRGKGNGNTLVVDQ